MPSNRMHKLPQHMDLQIPQFRHMPEDLSRGSNPQRRGCNQVNVEYGLVAAKFGFKVNPPLEVRHKAALF